MSGSAIFILAILAAVAGVSITGSDAVAAVAFLAVLVGLLAWRELALWRSRREHAARIRAIAAWEAENAGKPRHLWSPTP